MIKIKPCLLSWFDLSIKGKEKHCGSCNKFIPDLSNKSEQEILNLYNQRDGSLCGKLSYSQINGPNNYSKLTRFVFALILVFGTNLFSISAKAQDTINSINNHLNSNTEGFYSVSGNLLDENNKPLPFCNIWFENNGHRIGATSDFDGKYRLTFEWTKGDSVRLFYQFIGYEQKSIFLKKTESKNIIIDPIVLKENDHCLVGIILINQRMVSSEPDDMRETTFRLNDLNRHPRK